MCPRAATVFLLCTWSDDHTFQYMVYSILRGVSSIIYIDIASFSLYGIGEGKLVRYIREWVCDCVWVEMLTYDIYEWAQTTEDSQTDLLRDTVRVSKKKVNRSALDCLQLLVARFLECNNELNVLSSTFHQWELIVTTMLYIESE